MKNSQGCKESIIVDSAVLEQAHKDNRNLYIAYIDYHKAFDSVPHSWLIHVLEIYKIDPLIINSLTDEEVDNYPPSESEKQSDYE